MHIRYGAWLAGLRPDGVGQDLHGDRRHRALCRPRPHPQVGQWEAGLPAPAVPYLPLRKVAVGESCSSSCHSWCVKLSQLVCSALPASGRGDSQASPQAAGGEERETAAWLLARRAVAAVFQEIQKRSGQSSYAVQVRLLVHWQSRGGETDA